MSKRYLSSNNRPIKMPFMSALWTVTTLKVFDAPQWVWIVFVILYFLAFVYESARMLSFTEVEL